ncbi:zwei Ig domain protein zig-8 [Culex quinquefasciatus]|uniref:zwei Ig domain protein zig-8 n=1 Tax=Culex quinquefasciatus TaxID=7176 RepID=UPI0018E2FD3D|nr:zwei Ig domain protein zig-8 [Culex quinquefasciatus]
MHSAIINGLFLLANLHFCQHKANGIISGGGGSDGGGGPGAEAQQQHYHSVIKKFSPHPYFDFDIPRNVTTRVGQTAFINCRVEQIGDKWVSWIRKRDLHILSAGMVVYTSDERFQVTRSERSEVWTMQIKFAQQRDSGAYECQVNTVPKMSMTFQLNVVEAKALILGPTDIYVKIGSAVTLTCIITQGPHDLGTIFWYRGTNIIKPTETHPNETSVAAAYPPRISVELKWTEALTSRLKIMDAKLSDSGNYTCMPTSAEVSSVMVHVINEENPAAMQRGGTIVSQSSTPCQLYLLVALVLLVSRCHPCWSRLLPQSSSAPSS